MADFPWFKSYPEFVPKEISVDNYANIGAIYDEAVSKFGDRIAYKNMDTTLTFNELDEQVNALIWYLQNRTNLKPGDRIALQMPNLLQMPVAIFACLKAGYILVNTNPLYTADEMLHQYKDSEAKVIIILENFAANLEKILDQTSIETVILTRVGDMCPPVKGSIVNLVVKHVKKMVPSFSLPSAKRWKDCLKEGLGKNPQNVDIQLSDVAFLQYTGGTTGVSKGAELTHGNICANVQQVEAWIGSLFEEGQETIITALPLYHIFALTANCVVFFRYGATNVLITNPRDMKSFMKDLKKNPFSILTGVNTLFNGMMNQEAFRALDFTPLKLALGGGMAVQDVVADRWQKITGSPLLEAYGLSETSPAATINPVDGTHQRGTIGLPLPNTELGIFDDNYNRLGFNEPGEIGVKGPQVMKGYWKRQDETDRCMKNGFFMTGDIGIMKEDGFFKIVDRKKEMINVSGFNVFPNEIEKIIAEHPKVLEVGVRGETDDSGKEYPKAFIIKKDSSLTAEEIQAFCHEKLTNYKVPREVVFRDELPKSNVGKILRRKLV
ncbi:MAG: AMP-binding protein [Flavobacteriales bacterium]|nr:AMP-binding protein [Bacteroidota bacterium]MCB9239714.1 AMP-binding protein [Flavobacteriales bacterium]